MRSDPSARLLLPAMALVILLLPLAVVPPAFDSFIGSKEVLFTMATALLAALAVVVACFGSPLRVYTSPVNGVLVVLGLWTLASVLWSDAPSMTLEESARLWTLIVFALLFQSAVARRRGRLLFAAKAMALGALAIAAWTIFQDFRTGFAPGTIRVRATLGDWRDSLSTVGFGNTSHLADFLILGFHLWLFAFLTARSRGAKLLATGALWMHAAALIVSWSVHSNLSLIVSVVIWGFLLWDYFGREELARMGRRMAVLAAGWAFIVAFYVVDHPANPHGSAVWAEPTEQMYAAYGRDLPPEGFSGGIFSQAFSSPRWVAGLETRLAIWGTSLEIVRQHPWLGTGAGTFTWIFPATRSPLVENSPKLAPYASVWTNAAHNELLQAWAEMGIVGAALLVMLVVVSMKLSWDRLREGTSPGNALIVATAMAMLAAQCLQGMMNFPLQLPVASMQFMILLAVPVMVPRRGEEEAEFLVPVERSHGPLHIGVVMKNMAWPMEVSLTLRGNRQLSLIVTGTACLLAVGVLILPLRRLAADIRFRAAYDRKQLANQGMAGWDAVAADAQRALDLWPRHGDALSTRQDALLRIGDFQAVVDITPSVLQKLNATEVYQRRAESLMQLNRGAEATPDWDEIFTRRPELGPSFPGPFAEYLRRLEAAEAATQP